MQAIDATGGSDDRFLKIEAAIIDLIYGSAKSVQINRSVGNGVVTYTEARLQQVSEATGQNFPVTRIPLGHMANQNIAAVVAIAQSNGGIVIIDEAEFLDTIPGMADALRALESPEIKFVHIATVPDPLEDLMDLFGIR